MIDRAQAPVLIVTARIGRTTLGSAALTFEEDALSLALREANGDGAIRVELASVEAVAAGTGDVIIPLRDGSRLVLETDAPADLRDSILARCLALPELTRTLRALGSRRGQRSARADAGDEQRRFFAPFLDARRAAANAATPADTVAAFDADALAASVRRTLQGFAALRFPQLGPERRALEAALFEAIESLQESLSRMSGTATDAVSVIGELRPWRMWAAELRASFEAADHAWLALDLVLEATPKPASKPASKTAQ